MRNTKHSDVLLGAGLLSAITVLSVAQPTLAAPDREVREERRDVKQARKEVRQQQRDVNRADTRAERRDEQQDVRAARENLRIKRHELKQERWENKGGRYNDTRRYDYNRRDFRTIEGIVTPDFRGNEFNLRTSSGQNIMVRVRGGEPRRISRGDRVRVYGSLESGFFTADNISVLRDR
jgi:Ni/Co efflux regulator RcnB